MSYRKFSGIGRIVWLAALFTSLGALTPGQGSWPDTGAAFAQADDDGDDDADDDAVGAGTSGDDSGSRASTAPAKDGQFRPPVSRRTPANPPVPSPARAAEAAPLPAFAAGEIVVTDLTAADLAALLAEGFVVIERVDLVDVAATLHRLRVPAGLTLEQARDRVRAQPSGATGDFNHYYRHEQGMADPPGNQAPQPAALAPVAPCAHLNCAVLDLIDWPSERDWALHCRVTVPVGMIDTGVNAAHANLSGADIEVLRLVAEAVDPSQAVHGTALAALLVGQSDARAPGLIPEAKLVVVDVFGRDGGDERASVVALVKALDVLAERKVKVINMSLAGPANAALEAALMRLASLGGAVVLAAAGNAGPGAEVAYPAGYPSVLAVTAVDQRGQIYRRAQRGAHVDLAAPGVDIWSATSIKGVKPKTGTSFAVPFATAVAAVLASRDPLATPDMVAGRLRTLVRDIGATGPDEVFGAGLLSLATLCQPEIFAAPVE